VCSSAALSAPLTVFGIESGYDSREVERERQQE